MCVRVFFFFNFFLYSLISSLTVYLDRCGLGGRPQCRIFHTRQNSLLFVNLSIVLYLSRYLKECVDLILILPAHPLHPANTQFREGKQFSQRSNGSIATSR